MDLSLPETRERIFAWLFLPNRSERSRAIARFIVFRALGVIYFSVFYSLAFQILGLMGENGILPVTELLAEVRAVHHGVARFYDVPTLLWINASDGALHTLVGIGLIASLLLLAGVWQRATLATCMVLFLSFVTAAQEFSSYQSDSMLLEASLIGLFLAPRGFKPSFGMHDPPSRAAGFLWLWECFRIYFESGVAKIASGDRSWRDFSAMDRYYETGPLPTWIGWYVQQLPVGFHRATAFATLAIELALVFGMFGPRRVRVWTFILLSLLQVGIIATANYTFLNYLVLVLGFMMLDDAQLRSISKRAAAWFPAPQDEAGKSHRILRWASAFGLVWIFWATISQFAFAGAPEPIDILDTPARILRPFRVANRYGLFAVMTPGRFEIEMEGSRDGTTWLVYPFRYKPQALDVAPGIYAPYQPRFEWNLWFASLGTVEDNMWVLRTSARLLDGSPDVVGLFARDPFAGKPPRYVRVRLWQYKMTDLETKRRTGAYWSRELLGTYAPTIEMVAPKKFQVVNEP